MLRFWRRREVLTYNADGPRVQGPFQRAALQFNEVFCKLSYGSGSLRTWKLRCEASLRASRRRRGLDA